MSEAPIYSAERPYEIAWIPGWADGPHAGRVKVGPHQPPRFSTWVNEWPEKGTLASSVGHSGSGWPKEAAAERKMLIVTALDLLMSGCNPKELQHEFWQIGQWREIVLPLGGCLFLDNGTWSPHNCDGDLPPHNLRALD